MLIQERLDRGGRGRGARVAADQNILSPRKTDGGFEEDEDVVRLAGHIEGARDRAVGKPAAGAGGIKAHEEMPLIPSVVRSSSGGEIQHGGATAER